MRWLRLTHGGLDYFARQIDDSTARLWDGAPWANAKETDRLVPLKRGALLPPVTPSKIVCVGRNYRAHAKELGNEVPTEPLIFMKPPSALLASGESIVLPPQSERVEYEGEIAVVIGAALTRASEDECERGIFGFCAANDVTARDIQRKEVQFTRAKGFDTFCPMGPAIESELDWKNLRICTKLDGSVVQQAPASDMVFSIPYLLSFISQGMTLLPGDVVLTGTPHGVGPLSHGQTVEVILNDLQPLLNLVSSPSLA